ncbi:MAG: hypothetical protein IT379_38505, partial [Deltaproteobacteria bacterium]|nr:hypothetical protein [Deltaproteobacteria bacterium]
LNPQLPLANPPLPVGPVPPGLVQAPLVPPDPSSGLPGALVGGVGGGQPYGTVGTTSSLGTDGTELEQYTWPANAVYKYEEEPEKPDPDVARHYKVYDPTAAPPEKKSFIHDPTSPDRDLVRLRMEALIAESQIMRLTTDLAGVMPGTILLLKRGWLYPCPDTPTAQQTQRLLVRRVRHIGNDPQSTIAPPSTDEWFLADASFQNLVEVQWLDPQDPTRTPYRPPLRTARPVVSGIQTATVVDTSMKDPEDAEQQLHSDHRALGRVMVRFHWDRRGENMLGVNVPFDIQGVSRGHTAWIRVSQPWAGDDYGYSFVPRVGMEVVVAFEDGNPDRPLIIGCVYNGLETPPLGWEKERTHSIVCTRPNPYDDEAKKQEGHPHNELRFVDDRDAEEIRVVARKYLVEEVRHDMWTRVVNDQTNEVVGNHGEIVRNYQHLEVSGDRDKTVGSYELVEIGGQRVAEVHGNDTLEVTWSRDQKIEGAQTVHVGSPEAGEEKRRSLTVYGTRKTDIGFPLDPELGPRNDVFTIEGNEKITVTGKLTVLAGSFGVGMPAAPGSPVHDASMSARTEDELGDAKDTLAIRSQKDVALEAKGEVALVSEHCGAQLDAGEKLEILAGDSKLVLDASSALGPLTIESAKKVVIECATSKIEMSDSSVLLSAKGSPAAEMVFNASGIGLKGGSLALIARAEIEVSGGAIKV